jgi:hypothetical protein
MRNFSSLRWASRLPTRRRVRSGGSSTSDRVGPEIRSVASSRAMVLTSQEIFLVFSK